jgi:hypothetical protein
MKEPLAVGRDTLRWSDGKLHAVRPPQMPA